jgi:hypothetical protein
MPYLQESWAVVGAYGRTEVVPRGLWVPDRDWSGWQSRAADLPLAYRWREEDVRAGEEPYRLPRSADSLTDGQRDEYLRVLGADLGSVQRDNFFYANFVEQLKQSPEDATADKVVKTMEDLDFTSIRWPESIGGPPPHRSPLPWRGVLRWLIQLAAKAGKIILKIADFISGVLIGGGVGVSAVTISAGVPSPQIGIEVSTDLFNGRFWLPVRQFLDEVQAKFAEGL